MTYDGSAPPARRLVEVPTTLKNAVSFYVMMALLSTLVPHPAHALNNGVGAVPAMGWNSWNTFRCNINEALIKEVAAALVDTGLRDAGYVYVNIDDCWMSHREPDTGRIVPFADKFPSGLKALGDHLHGLGLKFGVYSDSGNKTCEGYPGSYGHEEVDAATYAEWGVDYLKYDFCNMNNGESEKSAYSRMRDALNATGRPILYSLCSWGGGGPHRWGHGVGNSWRTSPDLFAVWDRAAAAELRLPNFLISVTESVEAAAGLAPHAGIGGYNDPDMLVVGLDEGMYPYGIVQRCPDHVPGCKPGQYITREQWGLVGGLTQVEQKTHFSMWCVMASPLILGNDPRSVSKRALAMLTAKEVVAVNQDPLGLQAARIQRGDNEVWAKAMADGSVAVLLVNRAAHSRGLEVDLDEAWRRATRHGGGGGGVDTRQKRGANGNGRGCEDTNDNCEGWAGSGECEKNPGFMHTDCKFSCGKCPVQVKNVADTGSGVGGDGTVRLSSSSAAFMVRDLWRRQDLGTMKGTFRIDDVVSHDSVMIRIAPPGGGGRGGGGEGIRGGTRVAIGGIASSDADSNSDVESGNTNTRQGATRTRTGSTTVSGSVQDTGGDRIIGRVEGDGEGDGEGEGEEEDEEESGEDAEDDGEGEDTQSGGRRKSRSGRGVIRDGDGRVISPRGGFASWTWTNAAAVTMSLLQTVAMALVWAVPGLRRAVGTRLLRGAPPGSGKPFRSSL